MQYIVQEKDSQKFCGGLLLHVYNVNTNCFPQNFEWLVLSTIQTPRTHFDTNLSMNFYGKESVGNTLCDIKFSYFARMCVCIEVYSAQVLKGSMHQVVSFGIQ